MEATIAKVVGELRSLRKGRGVQAGDLHGRLDHHLGRLAAGERLGEDTDPRRGLVRGLTRCLQDLPEDLRTAVSAALGLRPETRDLATLTDRIGWLAQNEGYSDRTALRRVDVGEKRLAEAVLQAIERVRTEPGRHQVDWNLERFETLLRLDTPLVEAHEHRTIKATRDGVREIFAWMDVPATADGTRPRLDAEMLYGGRLVRQEAESGGLRRFVVRLPAPLAAGQTHTYGMVLRLAEGASMRPHYIFTPECECGRFELRVRFDTGRLPQWVRRVDGEPVRMFDAAEPGADRVTLNDDGEIMVGFDLPVRYLGYGAQWRP